MNGKFLLKKCFEGRVPRETIERKKAGFPIPYESWFRNELRSFLRELLLGDQARERGYFRPKAIESLLDRDGGPDTKPPPPTPHHPLSLPAASLAGTRAERVDPLDPTEGRPPQTTGSIGSRPTPSHKSPNPSLLCPRSPVRLSTPPRLAATLRPEFHS